MTGRHTLLLFFCVALGIPGIGAAVPISPEPFGPAIAVGGGKGSGPIAARLAQEPFPDVSQFPRLEPSDLPERYRKWLEEEIVWIITEDERDIFLRLQSDEQREAFVEQFWLERDPTPGTPKNEYYELHHERLAYANRIYGRSTVTPGWMTDRGRMHILLGEPMNKTRLENDMLLQPTEIWLYHADPELGVPPYFYLVFYKRHNSGDYRLYSPVADGPRLLLNPAGEDAVRQYVESRQQSYGFAPTGFSGYTESELAGIYDVLRGIDSDIAIAAFSLYPSDGGMEYISPLQSEILIGKIGAIPEVISPSAAWAARVLTGTTDAIVRFETLGVDAVATALLDTNGIPFVHFAAQTLGASLNLGTFEENYYFTFDVSGALTDERQRIIHVTEANIHGDLGGEEEATRFRSSPFLYVDRLPAAPGRRTFDLILENNVTHEFGRNEFAILVPSPHPPELTFSDPLLCVSVQRVQDYSAFGTHYPFQIGEWLLMPSADSVFARDAQLYVYHQFHLPAAYGQVIAISYVLSADDGTPELQETLTLRPQDADVRGVMNQLTSLDLTGLGVGSYTMTVEIEADDSWAKSYAVAIEQPDPQGPRTFVNVQEQPPGTDPETSIELALQHRKLGQVDEAIAYVARALSGDPGNVEAVRLNIELFMEARRYEELDSMLKPMLAEDPGNIELLLRLAEANAHLARHYDAIRYYERARLAAGRDTPELLNPLAAEYYAEGNLAKTRELLERSLEMDPDQPEIQRLLDLARQEQQQLS